jgi:hypothetical protein
MIPREFRIRLLVEVGFFLFLFAAFLCEALGSDFCGEPGREVAVRQSFNLALTFSAWDSIAGGLSLFAARALRRSISVTASCLLIGTVAALGCFAAMTFLPPGEQVGPFRSALDSSCFFTEGYGMMFPFTWAPFLVIATTFRELLTQRILRRARGD